MSISNNSNNSLSNTAATNTLTAPQFQQLAAVPSELEWFANLDNPQTRRAYANDVNGFMQFLGLTDPAALRLVCRTHVLAWRKQLEGQGLSRATIRRKLAAVSSMFAYLCEQNAILHNPVQGVKRPKADSYEGKTPALGQHEARRLLHAPDANTLKGLRDQTILSLFLYHGLRREEVSALRVRDVHLRQGVWHIRVDGKGGKIRYLPLHPATAGLLDRYLDQAGHKKQPEKALFHAFRGRNLQKKGEGISADGLYKIILDYAKKAEIATPNISPHSLRATAATNALEHESDIAKVQEWLGHANIATTRLYDRRQMRPEDSPTFRILY